MRPHLPTVEPEYSEVPFRSLIARSVDDLMVAGRCFYADYHANGEAIR